MKEMIATTDTIENLLYFMNLFKTSELLKYKLINESNEERLKFVLIFKFGVINKTKFNNRVKTYKAIYGDTIKFEEIV